MLQPYHSTGAAEGRWESLSLHQKVAQMSYFARWERQFRARDSFECFNSLSAAVTRFPAASEAVVG